MRKFVVTAAVLGVFFATGAAAAANDPTNYPFLKKIQIPAVSSQQTAELIFDTEMFRAVDEDFKNFTILTAKNDPVEFDVFFEKFHRAQNIEVIETSSERSGDPENLVDDNTITSFKFDERVDGTGASWALLDLGETAPLSRIETVVTVNPGVKFLQIEAGLNPETLKPVTSKKVFQWRTELETEPVRFVKISLWGVGVAVDDIKITLGGRAIAYWNILPDESYRAFFGGDTSIRREYRFRAASPRDDAEIHARTGKATWNERFPADVDQDSILNTNDNCPFIANKKQGDSDDDHIGDACDNAPEVKNFAQIDSDHDGIGDYVDNCKFVVNPEQEDRDEDDWGDACDNAHATESWKPQSREIIEISIGALLILAGLGVWQFFRVRRRKK